MNRRFRHWHIALLPLGLWSCGEAVSPTAPEAPTAEEAPVEVQAALSDKEYLVRLGLMRGHLLVGHELYGLNALDAARSHSKHPTDELYAGMEREFGRARHNRIRRRADSACPGIARRRPRRRQRGVRNAHGKRSRAPNPRSLYRRR